MGQQHPRPADRSVASAIVALLHAVGTQMHAAGTRFAAREHLHPTDLQALSLLARADGPMTAGELAKALQLSTGATTRLVDRLERAGHVQRRPDRHDRRRRRIGISPTARATAGGYFGELVGRIDRVVAGLSEAEQRVVERFLDALVRSLELPAADRPPERTRTRPGHQDGGPGQR
ncbi:MarR family winged helix-turn-helix transcriptional regulator [Egicoccus sp. AB-alg2]|uniref:MarR family winged helix-turn-helix transcriptional regulator n=1 Tax=Egicoccus sp. AB-alg2 TaxID=3242693 RepID=UPI00359E534E